MKRIRVLHISETFAAGVYTYIKDVCGVFKDDPVFETYVIYSGKRKDTAFEKFKTDFDSTVKLIEVPLEREISPIKDFKSLLSIGRQIKRIKPDVIHLHSSKAGIVGRIASKVYPKAKVFYTPHGYAFMRQDISIVKRKVFKFIELAASKIFGGTTIACGDGEYELAGKIGKALLVRNGIGPFSLKNKAKHIQSSRFTIGTVGRLSPQKNPSLFNNVAENFPNIEFVWIGDGELKKVLISKNIRTTGWLPHADVLECLTHFDIYIQTSLWEGLPFTIIEAMVLGKPIIATNIIGNNDAVKNGYNGFLCNSLEEIIESINNLRHNRDLFNEMKNNSRVRALELFDRDKNLIKLKDIYQGTDMKK